MTHAARAQDVGMLDPRPPEAEIEDADVVRGRDELVERLFERQACMPPLPG
jgi:hypothetical protein